MLERCLALKPCTVYRKFVRNTISPTEQQWLSAHKLVRFFESYQQVCLCKQSLIFVQCQLLKPLREISVPFEGEKYTMLSGLSRLISTLNTALGSNIPPPSWNLGLGFHCFALQCVHIFIGVKAWDELLQKCTTVIWNSKLDSEVDLILLHFYLLMLH